MSFKELMVKELGEEGYRRLSPSFKALVSKIDALPPIPSRVAARLHDRASV